jgi:hypothetical protein
MKTNFGIVDWFRGRKLTFSAPGLGKLALLENIPQALAVEADDICVYLRRFHVEHEWALLDPAEARLLASNSADSVDSARSAAR